MTVYFEVVAAECHCGLLTSRDDLAEAMEILPLPEGIITCIPTILGRGKPVHSHGLVGVMNTSRNGSLQIRTNPRKRHLVLTARNINFRPQDEKRIYSFLYNHFGAKNLSLA